MANLILVGTQKGLYWYRRDASGAWALANSAVREWEVASVLPLPGGRWIIGTGNDWFGSTLRLSDDGGNVWRQIEHGPAYTKESGKTLKRIWQVAAGHVSSPNTIYAGVDAAGLFVSHDAGEHWAEVEGLAAHPTRPYWMPGAGGLCLHTILVDTDNAQRMWVGVSAAGVFRTDDGGQQWKICNTGLPALFTGSRAEEVCCCVHKIIRDPSAPDRLFMQYHGGVFRSDDAADSWQRIETGLPGNFGFPLALGSASRLFIAPLQAESSRIFSDGAIAIYHSDDAGENWSASSSGLPDEPHFTSVLRDAMSASPSGVICFGTTTGNLFVSDDNGSHWQRLPGQLPRINCVRVAVV